MGNRKFTRDHPGYKERLLARVAVRSTLWRIAKSGDLIVTIWVIVHCINRPISLLLSRWTEVCRVYWAIILSHCDHDIWRTDLKIHRVDGRDTAYIPTKFNRNSFKYKREISGQHIFQGCLLVTLTFNLRPWNLHQVVSLSRTINQLNLKTMGW